MTRAKGGALPLRMVNTRTASQIDENANAEDWAACSECGAEYLLFHLEGGVCKRCADRVIERERRLKEVFKGMRRLLEMSTQRFQVTPENRRAFDVANSFNPKGENLYLWSQPTKTVEGKIITTGAGTGKTMLAARILRKAASQGLSCAFEIPEKWLRSLYGIKGDRQQQEIDKLVYASVLVLDDLGLEPMTETGFSVRGLYDVINSRWLNKQNGMVITSNMSLDQLANHFRDDRIPSRICGMCKLIEMSGRDWRQTR